MFMGFRCCLVEPGQYPPHCPEIRPESPLLPLGAQSVGAMLEDHYFERRRARLVVDAEGRIVGPVAANDGQPGPAVG